MSGRAVRLTMFVVAVFVGILIGKHQASGTQASAQSVSMEQLFGEMERTCKAGISPSLCLDNDGEFLCAPVFCVGEEADNADK